MKPWMVLVNPRAGRNPTSGARVEAALRARNVPAEIHEVDSLGALEETMGHAVAGGGKRFVAVGGDGTVNAVLNALLSHDWDAPPVLGVLPAGTGCDLVRTFGIGRSLPEAVERLAVGTGYPVDVGVAIGSWGRRYFLNAASAGLTAAAGSAALRFPRRLGTLRYIAAVAASLPRFRASQIEVEAGRRGFEEKSLGVVLANGQFYGGGFNIAPRASMVDQLFDTQIITAPKRHLARLMYRARGGNHLPDPGVRRFLAQEVRVDSKEPWPVEVDGDPVGNTPLLVRLQADRILLMI